MDSIGQNELFSKSCKQTTPLPQFTRQLTASTLRLSGGSIRSLKSFHGVILPHFHSIGLPITLPIMSHLITHIDDARLDVVINLLGRFHEGLLVSGRLNIHLLDVRSRLCRSLQKDQAVLLRELGSLLRRHRTTMGPNKPSILPMVQIRLVADQHDHHVRGSILPRLRQPLGELCERLATRNIVHQQRSRSSAVVRARNRTERLLTGLQHDGVTEVTRTVSQI